MKDMLIEVFTNEIFRNLLYIIAMVAIVIICTYVAKWLKSEKTAAVASATAADAEVAAARRKIRDDLITRAFDIVERCVVATNQLIVDKLKQDAKFDKEAKDKAFYETWDNVLELMSDEITAAVSETYSNFNHWLKLTIESFVNKHKNDYLTAVGELIEFPAGTIEETGGGEDVTGN